MSADGENVERPHLSRYLMAYDADCGSCTKFKSLVAFLDSYRRIEPISLTKADKLGLLENIPQALRYNSFHLISPSGNIESGAEAFPTLIGLLPSGGPISKLIMLAPGGRGIVRFAYSVFSRLHDTMACTMKNQWLKPMD